MTDGNEMADFVAVSSGAMVRNAGKMRSVAVRWGSGQQLTKSIGGLLSILTRRKDCLLKMFDPVRPH